MIILCMFIVIISYKRLQYYGIAISTFFIIYTLLTDFLPCLYKNSENEYKRTNNFNCLNIIFIYSIVFIPLFYSSYILLSILMVIACLINFAFSFNIITFKEQQIERFFPLRPYNRLQIFKTEDISELEYIMGGKSDNKLNIYLKSGKIIGIWYSSKSYQIEKDNAYFSWYSNQGIKHNFNKILKEL